MCRPSIEESADGAQKVWVSGIKDIWGHFLILESDTMEKDGHTLL